MKKSLPPPPRPSHPMLVRAPSDPAHDEDAETMTVRLDCRQGDFARARLHFLRLREPHQLRLLEDIPRAEAVRLAGGLPPYTVARLCERVPRSLGRAIVRALPEGKRQGVNLILDYRKRI
ncbi:hypothetical protein CKO25_04805 [Thiocapsa imhoffii]|uniref:Uncharacterized protein n=2 Tax=Thiocapsa imhoffii TaxID=382777 RepID=A0A9X1B8D6_9GAMM|nr:hypothetical protein [Thiocapsa imhoffii]